MEQELITNIKNLINEFNTDRLNMGCHVIHVGDVSVFGKIEYTILYYHCVLSKLLSMARIPLITEDHDKNKLYIDKSRKHQTTINEYLLKIINMVGSMDYKLEETIRLYKEHKCTSFLRKITYSDTIDDNLLRYNIIDNLVKSNSKQLSSDTDKQLSSDTDKLSSDTDKLSSDTNQVSSDYTKRYWHKSYIDAIPDKHYIFNDKSEAIANIRRNSGISVKILPYYVFTNNSAELPVINNIAKSARKSIKNLHPAYIDLVNKQLEKNIYDNLRLCYSIDNKQYTTASTNVVLHLNHNLLSTSIDKDMLILAIINNIREVMYFIFTNMDNDTDSYKYREEYYMSSNIIYTFLIVLEKNLKAYEIFDTFQYPFTYASYQLYKEQIIFAIKTIIQDYDLDRIQSKFERIICF